jgi:hypothetical protein
VGTPGGSAAERRPSPSGRREHAAGHSPLLTVFTGLQMGTDVSQIRVPEKYDLLWNSS